MATASQANISIPNDWVDLVVLNGSLASVDIFLQNAGRNDVSIVFGGTAPSGEKGFRLAPGDSITGNAAAVWAKSDSGTGTIAAALI